MPQLYNHDATRRDVCMRAIVNSSWADGHEHSIAAFMKRSRAAALPT